MMDCRYPVRGPGLGHWKRQPKSAALPARAPAFLPLLLVLLLALCLLPALSACTRAKPVLGEIDEQAPVALLRFETIDKGFSGIVYREVLDLPTFLGNEKLPVLLVFHQPGDAVERQLIPLVEQFADDYKDRVSVVFIDARAKPALGSLYGIETVPQYILVKSGSARLTMNGFDETTRSGLEKLVQMAA